MIKAATQTGLGVPLAFFGLSGENITRLVAGEPVRVKAAEMQQMGLPAVEVVIHYGRTEQDIVDEMRAHGITLNQVENRPGSSVV